MNRPEPLLSFSDYMEDFQSRIEIHNYEIKKLQEDVKFVVEFLLDKLYYNSVTD